VKDRYGDTLLDNMLNLYIKKRILSDDKSSFYSRIYTTKDEQELALLEQLMKTVLLRVLRIQRIPFSFEHGEEGDTSLKIHERTTCRLDGFCRKRSSAVSENNDAISFDNVIMDREPLTIMPLEIIDKDYRKILLVGMCEEEGTSFHVFRVTRRLVCTELHSDLDFDRRDQGTAEVHRDKLWD